MLVSRSAPDSRSPSKFPNKSYPRYQPSKTRRLLTQRASESFLLPTTTHPCSPMPALPLLTLSTIVVLSFGLYPPVFARPPTIRAGAPLSDRREHHHFHHPDERPIETATIFTTTFKFDPPPPTTAISSSPTSSEPLTTSSSRRPTQVSSSRSSRSVLDTQPPALPASSSSIASPASQSPTFTSSSAPSGVAAASGILSDAASHRVRTLAAAIIVPTLVVGIVVVVWLACRYRRSRRTNNSRVTSSFEANHPETSPSTSHSHFSLSKTSARRARMAGYTRWIPTLPPRDRPLPLPPSPTSAHGSQLLPIGPESRSIAGSQSEKHSSTGTLSGVLELAERDNNVEEQHPFAEVQVQGRPSTSTSMMTTESRAPSFATVDPATGSRDSTSSSPVPPTPPPHYSRMLPRIPTESMSAPIGK
ncbi:hypothetical protein C8F01DRAFT_554827 [Mycena amicta]|nr:hypothetical protein C8F01DRAFT_554827 [Mycena amicta]